MKQTREPPRMHRTEEKRSGLLPDVRSAPAIWLQTKIESVAAAARNKAGYKVLNCNDTILWKKRGLGWMSILLLDEG